MNSNSITINIFWKFAERILAQFISFVVSILLARILLPEYFGTVAMVMVIINIANAFVTSGIPAALIQAKEAKEEEFSSIFYFNIIFSLILYLLMFCFAPIIGEFYNDILLVPIVRVMGIAIIFASINSVQHSYVSRHMMFKKFFLSTLCGTTLSGIIGITMAYFNCGVWALVTQYMTSTILNTIVLFLTVQWWPKCFFSWCKVKKLLRFGWKMIFEGVFAVGYNQLSNLIIGKVYSPSDLAYYSRGEQLSSVLVYNVSVSISSVLFPAMSAIQDETDKVKLLLRTSVKLTTFILFPLLFCLAMLAEPIIHILLTEKWNGCIPFLQLFCLIYGIQVGMYPRHQALLAIGRSDVFMNEHIIGRVFGIIFLILLYKQSVLAIVASVLVSTIVQMIIIMFTSKQYTYYTYKEQFKDIFPSIMGCIIMTPFIICIRYLINNDWVQLIISFPIGMFVYLLYSYISKLDEFNILKITLMRMRKSS